MVESWIKEGENDKSDYYGLQALLVLGFVQ